jgi:hypothetical protein
VRHGCRPIPAWMAWNRRVPDRPVVTRSGPRTVRLGLVGPRPQGCPRVSRNRAYMRRSPAPAERQQCVVGALAAAQSQESVRQDAAFEERVELVLDEPRQPRTGAGLGVSDEVVRVPLHQPIRRGLLRSVARVVQRHAIGCARCGVIAGWAVMAGAGHTRPARSKLRTVSAPTALRRRPQDRAPSVCDEGRSPRRSAQIGPTPYATTGAGGALIDRRPSPTAAPVGRTRRSSPCWHGERRSDPPLAPDQGEGA